jgi:hemerythrin-like metal-binding protein
MRLPQSLLTGHPEVDAQHARILEELERIRAAGPSGITVLLSFLSQHIRSHFAYEELLMDEVGYPDADPHKAEHRRFVDTVVQLQELVRRDRDRARSLTGVIAAVEKWVLGHVMRSDHKLADFIRERRGAA